MTMPHEPIAEQTGGSAIASDGYGYGQHAR
jgi:hypothetical protein